VHDQIAAAERAAFFGRPAEGFELLRPLVDTGDGVLPQRLRVRWLSGVCALAVGEHAEAIDLLRPAVRERAQPDARAWLSYCCSTLGSTHRQLADYAQARELDLRARAIAGGDLGALGDAVVGLAADSVGLGDLRMAAAHLEEAEHLLTGWRAPIRLQWVRTEVALLLHRLPAAVEASAHAVQLARRARAPRYVGKSALFHAAVLLAADRPAAAQRYARICLRVLDDFGVEGLRWPTLAVLSDALAAQEQPADDVRRECAEAVLAQADRIPATMREAWLRRPEVAQRFLPLGSRLR